MKIGLSANINVSKIDKDRLFQGKNGKYLDLTIFLDTEETGQYGDHGTIRQSTKKDEDDLPIIGNVKVFWKSEQSHGNSEQPFPESPGDDIPFG